MSMNASKSDCGNPCQLTEFLLRPANRVSERTFIAVDRICEINPRRRMLQLSRRRKSVQMPRKFLGLGCVGDLVRRKMSLI